MDRVIPHKPQFISTEPLGEAYFEKRKSPRSDFQDFEQNLSTFGSITEQQQQ